MNKVMSRTPQPQTRPRHRPPTRHDSRRPGGTPPRTPIRNSGDTKARPQDTTAPSPSRSPRTLPTPAPQTLPTPAPRTAPVPATAPATAVPSQRPTDVFADRLLAVLSGRRPVHWMLRHTAGRAYDDLAHLAEHSPLRTLGPSPVVHDIGYFVPRTGALEVFARIAAGRRLRAMAFRLEQGRDLRWRCTAVDLGIPLPPRGPED
ncbi:Rv3235 family protein [Streptomyces sp. NPDC048297]|uniref:Rv3235 family protein n=1 Tax=Streptomyces sp. NPDC048297 TaxID=3365531 RepID=UPI0037215FD8